MVTGICERGQNSEQWAALIHVKDKARRTRNRGSTTSTHAYHYTRICTPLVMGRVTQTTRGHNSPILWAKYSCWLWGKDVSKRSASIFFVDTELRQILPPWSVPQCNSTECRYGSNERGTGSWQVRTCYRSERAGDTIHDWSHAT